MFSEFGDVSSGGGDELPEFTPFSGVCGGIILRLELLDLSLEGINLFLKGGAHINLNRLLVLYIYLGELFCVTLTDQASQRESGAWSARAAGERTLFEKRGHPLSCARVPQSPPFFQREDVAVPAGRFFDNTCCLMTTNILELISTIQSRLTCSLDVEEDPLSDPACGKSAECRSQATDRPKRHSGLSFNS